MLLWLSQTLISLFFVLTGIAFITLLERIYMGTSQRRRGPNKISFWGMLQPILDGIKLIMKTTNKSYQTNTILFSWIPVISFCLFMTFWSAIPFAYKIMSFNLSVLFTLVLFGMMAFNVMITSWASNNKFALFGSLRTMTQSISYEITLALIILMMFCAKSSLWLYSPFEGYHMVEILFSWFFLVPMSFMALAECGRTPFDLLEAESELVSGYNVEYSSVEFAFLFMTEYGMIILLSILFSLIIVPQTVSLTSLLMITSILFLRYTLPRLRYDFLMSLMWKSLLPVMILCWFVTFNSSYT
uniref:NADH-ubiquinone oxidoreductase chain 1 n=23 Tax=Trichuris TaxID=36086 RepID=A0A0M4REJ3_TRITR|nr:NADH dehydrogenase subunit 1 [Trichuris sp. TTB1]ALF03948.1 NADH dehydrogenase subunit 1 [Trichuris trichiura]QRK25870.1 NADH dehydrogenase subunit 1 [Trichuris trichiura]